MVNIAVIDDEIIILNYIHKKINIVMNDLNIECQIYNFSDSYYALKEIEKQKFDIVFLDIDMPDVSGIEIAKQIRKSNSDSEIIFVTNKDELVYDVIKYAPFRFIRKSKFDIEIYEAIQSYIEKLNSKNFLYTFSTSNGKKITDLRNVKYVEASSHKLHVHEINSKFIANGNLNEIEEFLHICGFIKIHQSFIVNYRFIDLIKYKEVILDDATRLPISRGRYEKIKIDYMQLSREKW